MKETIVYVYGFASTDEDELLVNKIKNLIKNLENVQIFSEYGFSEDVRNNFNWYHHKVAPKNTNYIIGIDSNFRKLREDNKREIKQSGLPYRIIKI